MLQRVAERLSYANVIATLALFIALGGTGYAAVQLKKNSVGTTQLRAGAVTSAKVKDGSLLAADFKRGQLPTGAAGGQGATGTAGVAGPGGSAGTDGAPGANGAKGDVGPTGPTGPAGGTDAPNVVATYHLTAPVTSAGKNVDVDAPLTGPGSWTQPAAEAQYLVVSTVDDTPATPQDGVWCDLFATLAINGVPTSRIFVDFINDNSPAKMNVRSFVSGMSSSELYLPAPPTDVVRTLTTQIQDDCTNATNATLKAIDIDIRR